MFFSVKNGWPTSGSHVGLSDASIGSHPVSYHPNIYRGIDDTFEGFLQWGLFLRVHRSQYNGDWTAFSRPDVMTVCVKELCYFLFKVTGYRRLCKLMLIMKFIS